MGDRLLGTLQLKHLAFFLADDSGGAAGFRLKKEEPHHSFGHDLVGQEWELELV